MTMEVNTERNLVRG